MNSFCFSGKVWQLGDNVDTDAILPARFLNLTTEKELGHHFMQDVLPELAEQIRPGDILVAGENFGCGSSREHAPMAIRGCGVPCVVAASFSRLFFRNAINLGLPALTVREAGQILEGSRLRVDCMSGEVRDLGRNILYAGVPLSGFLLEVLSLGGLVSYMEEKHRRQQGGYAADENIGP